MTKMKKTLTFLFSLLLACAFSASAQGNSPFSWRANVKMTGSTDGEIIVKVEVPGGWHLYGMDLPKGGPKPTSFDFSKSTGVKLVGKTIPSIKPVSKVDQMFNLTLSYWTGNVTFRQKFKVTDPSKARIEGTVTYMGCNDNTCSPPSTFKISKLVIIKK